MIVSMLRGVPQSRLRFAGGCAAPLALLWHESFGLMDQFPVIGANLVRNEHVMQARQGVESAQQHQQANCQQLSEPRPAGMGKCAVPARGQGGGSQARGRAVCQSVPSAVRVSPFAQSLLRFGLASSLAAALLSVSRAASANGRFPKADLVVFEPGDPERLIVRTTFGLLESRDAGAHFDWICEAALELEDQEDPMIAITENGSVVAATVDGVVVAGEDECGFRRVAALDGEIIPDLALDRAQPHRVLAFRARGLQNSEFDWQLYSSEDDGDTFRALGDPLDRELLPLSVDLAPSESNRVYLTARLPRAEKYASVLLRSDDGGESFERLPIPGSADLVLAFLAAVSPDDPERVYVRLSDPEGTVLLTSGDAGESFSQVHRAKGALLGFAASPDGKTIAFGGPNDGVWLAAADGSNPERRSELGVSCLGWSEHGIYACSDSTEEFGVGLSTDQGAVFEPLLRFDELCGNRSCGDGTEVGRRCGSAWDVEGPRLGASCNVTSSSAGGGATGTAGAAPRPPAPASASGESGCALSGRRPPGAWWFAALGLVFVQRRLARPLATLIALFLLGCSAPTELEPYDGPPAYPNLRPVFGASAGRLAYVSNSLSDTIAVIDLEAFESVAEVPVGRDPVDIDGPHHLAIDRERGLMYVALSYPKAFADTGPHTHGMSERFGYAARLSLDDLRPLGEVRVDTSPGDIALSPSGERLVVSHYDLVRALEQTSLAERRASLVWFDSAESLGLAEAAESRLVVCVAPHAVVFSRDERRVFVACTGEDTIGVIDLDERAVSSRVPVASSIGDPGSPIHEPYALVADARVERLALSNLGSRTVSLFTAEETPERLWTTPVIGAPYFAAWLDAERLVVPLQSPSGVALIDAASGELLSEAGYGAGECLSPHEAVVSSEGRLFLVCEGDRVGPGAIVELDPDTLAVTRRLEVGVYPDRLLLREP